MVDVIPTELDLNIDFENADLNLSMECDCDLEFSLGQQVEFPPNYEELMNKPRIEGHVLVGNSTLPQIGVGDITEQDIDQIIYGG